MRNLGTDRTTTTKAASVRKQLGTKIARVTMTDRRRMVELRGETGVQRTLDRETAEEQITMDRTRRDDKLPKRAAGVSEEGRRRRRRPRLRWEDCVKRDVRKAGEDEDWKKKT